VLCTKNVLKKIGLEYRKQPARKKHQTLKRISTPVGDVQFLLIQKQRPEGGRKKYRQGDQKQWKVSPVIAVRKSTVRGRQGGNDGSSDLGPSRKRATISAHACSGHASRSVAYTYNQQVNLSFGTPWQASEWIDDLPVVPPVSARGIDGLRFEERAVSDT